MNLHWLLERQVIFMWMPVKQLYTPEVLLIGSLILQKLHSEVVVIGGPVTGAIPIVGA